MAIDSRDFLIPNEGLVRFIRRFPDFSSPSFQFYANEFLGSSRVMLMAPDSVGGYVILLAIAWNSTDCGLPDDDQKLSALSRLGKRWFAHCRSEIRECFFSHEDRLYNRRLLIVRKKQIEQREKARIAGIKSGEVRRGKNPQCELPLDGRSTSVEPALAERTPNTQSQFQAPSHAPDLKKTGSPDGGSLEMREPESALRIDGYTISGALWGKIRKKAGNDPYDAGRVLYRAHNAFLAHKRKGRDACEFDMVAWIMAGFKEPETGNGIPYAFKACREEDENPACVRRWIEREVLKLNSRSMNALPDRGPEKLSFETIQRAVPNLRTGLQEYAA